MMTLLDKYDAQLRRARCLDIMASCDCACVFTCECSCTSPNLFVFARTPPGSLRYVVVIARARFSNAHELQIGLMCNPPQENDESYELYAKERGDILESLKRYVQRGSVLLRGASPFYSFSCSCVGSLQSLSSSCLVALQS